MWNVTGRHTLKLGGEWMHTLNDQVFRGFFRREEAFDVRRDGGRALATVGDRVIALGAHLLHAEDHARPPRLPARLGRLCFRFRWRGRRLQVEITPEGVQLGTSLTDYDGISTGHPVRGNRTSPDSS